MNSKKLSIPQRLVVAADFKPQEEGFSSAMERTISLAKSLFNSGVCLKVNSLLRYRGYDLIRIINEYGVEVFADLKLCDISETLSLDGQFIETLASVRPDIVTVMCSAGEKSLSSLKKELPNSDVIGVTVLTSLREIDSQAIYGCSIDLAIRRLAEVAESARIDGLVSSPTKLSIVQNFGEQFSYITPGIRPEWSVVKGDDQNPEMVMTPEKAIKAGADRIVIGRPITQSKNPMDAVKRTLEEIEKALS